MVSWSYACVRCKRNFRGKPNVFRHSIAVHRTAETVSDSKNSSGLFSSLKNAKYASNNKFRKFKHLQSISNSPNYEDYLDELILEEFNKIDSEIMKNIGQIIKSYLELDDALI